MIPSRTVYSREYGCALYFTSISQIHALSLESLSGFGKNDRGHVLRYVPCIDLR